MTIKMNKSIFSYTWLGLNSDKSNSTLAKMFTYRIQFKLLIVSIIFSTNCATNNESQISETTTNPFGEINQVVKNIEDPNCFNDACTEINISYPSFSLSPKISRLSEKLITKQLSYYTKSSGGETINDLTENILNDYYTFLEDFPESKTPWNITLELNNTYASEKLICLKLKENSYTGGAHTNEMVYFNIINPSGDLLSINDWVNDMDQFKISAETEFRKTVKISENESYSDRGFQFENDQFQLSENIGLTAKEIILYYNKYEIGSYADGSLEIKIPYEKLKEIISI